MNPFAEIILLPQVAPAPATPVPGERTKGEGCAAAGAKEIGEMLGGLLNEESALYAITREWRYDTNSRKCPELQTLLDEQFSETGVRLTRLATRSRELGAWNSTGEGDRSSPPRPVAAPDASPTGALRELLTRHEQLIASLQRASVLAGGGSRDRKTTDLLAEFTADHEKDAFMLRALLWEVEHLMP